MRKIRAMCMFLLLLVSMLSLPLLVTAAVSDITFDRIDINDKEVVSDGLTNGVVRTVERGDDIEIRVDLESTVDTNVWLKASIDGYDYGEIRDSKGMFNVVGSITKHLHLQLPEDMEDGTYNLNVWVTDGTDKKEVTPTIMVLKSGHDLAIQDVILRPTSTVEAGRPLRVEVRLENMGSKKEEDIRVTASIKDLGVSTRAYLDELVFEEDVETDNYDYGETSDSVTLYLLIPVDAVSGEYDLDVDVEYDKGHEVVSTKAKVYVQGTQPAETKTVDTIISIDAVSKSVVKGGLVAYRLMLANLGDSEAVYSLGVTGTESWADVSLSPGFVRVAPNSAGELVLTVRPKDVATVGDHSFTLKVRQGEKTLRDVALSTSVSEHKHGLLGLRSVLEIGFAVLVALLVILGLVVAGKKLCCRRDNGKEPEPIMDNGQSYY